jgi:hypothetical protein
VEAGPVEEEYREDAEEDDLGYYEDGTKRTLTDEQIAIFRHSEIQALLRDRRRAAEAKHDKEDSEGQENASEVDREDGLAQRGVGEQEQLEEELEDGELGEELDTSITDLPSSPPITTTKQSKKKGKKAQVAKQKNPSGPLQKSFFKQHIKPDLRKRTWDNVDTGVESLDYDEGESGAASKRPMQRRRISYDDD